MKKLFCVLLSCCLLLFTGCRGQESQGSYTYYFGLREVYYACQNVYAGELISVETYEKEEEGMLIQVCDVSVKVTRCLKGDLPIGSTFEDTVRGSYQDFLQPGREYIFMNDIIDTSVIWVHYFQVMLLEEDDSIVNMDAAKMEKLSNIEFPHQRIPKDWNAFVEMTSTPLSWGEYGYEPQETATAGESG